MKSFFSITINSFVITKYCASIVQNRVWQRDYRDRRALQPDVIYYPDLLPPPSYVDNPINAVTTKFVKTATNKMRCPIFCMAWTPEGRRLVTGASSGEFTLWNGLTFNFETILQVRNAKRIHHSIFSLYFSSCFFFNYNNELLQMLKFFVEF